MMLEKFNTEIAQCLGSMSHGQLEDICWEGAQYLLVGDWRSPSVSLVVGQYTKLDHIVEPILVALRMEPLLFPCEPEGERLDNIEIRNALEMLLKEAEEVGVASLLMDGLKKCIFFQGLDRAECADLSASGESKDPA